MMKKFFIGLLILLFVGMIIFVIPLIAYISAFGILDKDYSVSDLKIAFSKSEIEILELKNYYSHLVPNNKIVTIEFGKHRKVERLEIVTIDSNQHKLNYERFTEKNLKKGSHKVDSIVKSMGWPSDAIDSVYLKLKKAGCIGVTNGEPTVINFQRCGMGMYSFNLFTNPISENAKAEYNDSCTYIYVNQHLVLEYGGGAIGPQCFYNIK